MTVAPWKKSYDEPRQHIKKQRYYFAIKGTSSQSYGFSSSHVRMRALDHKEGWALKNWCFWIGSGEDSWESLGLQGDPTSQTERRSVPNIHWKDWCWSSNTLATWCEELTHWKRPWCWERLRAGEEGVDRELDGWITSLTQWTWVWANTRRQWRKVQSGVLQSVGSQRVWHNWATEQQQNTGEAAIAMGFRIWKEMLKTDSGHLRPPGGAVILGRAYVL